MTLDGIDIKALASAMREAGIRSLKWNALDVTLDDTAFAPDPMEHVPPEFQEPPTDTELLFRSVEEGERQ